MRINKPTITPNQLNMYTEPTQHIYQSLEEEIFQMIAKRLRTSKNITKDTVFQWQAEKMSQLRLVNNETITSLSKTTGLAEKEIRNAIMSTGIDTIKSVDHELANVYAKLPLPTLIDRNLESLVNQTFREMNNFVNQSLVTTNYGTGTVTDAYRKIVEETTGKVLSGTKTVNKALSETVIKWGEQGINTGFIDRGGNNWTLERYAQQVIRSTVNRTYRDTHLSRMADYDVHTAIMTSLPDPREVCSHIQGHVVSTKPIAENETEYESIYSYGYGTPAGTLGANCRHQLLAFIPGINTNNQRQYNEKEMTDNREDRQKQRYYENRIRKAKRSLKLAETVGDEETITKMKKLLSGRQASIREHIKASGRGRDYSREQIYN